MKMKKYVVEFLGSFFLVLAVCLATGQGFGFFGMVSVGLMLMVMVYAGKHISGAHYNPAISLAVFLRGKLALGELPAYLVAQGVGGVLAALLSMYFLQRMPVTAPEFYTIRIGPALLAEFAGTFILTYVYLNVFSTKALPNNSYYGLAIGFAMTASMLVFGQISAAAFNPAIATGISVAQFSAWPDYWVYLAAELAGGAVAAFVFNYLNGPE